MVRRRFYPLGNSMGIIIPKMIMDMLKINPVLHDLDMEIDGDRIILKKLKRED